MPNTNRQRKPQNNMVQLSQGQKDMLSRAAKDALSSAVGQAVNAARNRSAAVTGSRRKRAVRTSANALLNQQRGLVLRGSMPDPGKFHWNQTPASNNVIAPRGFGYYDAFQNSPGSIMTSMSIGPATPITSTSIRSVQTRVPGSWNQIPETHVSDPGAKLMIIYPSHSSVQALIFSPGYGKPADDDSVSPQPLPVLTDEEIDAMKGKEAKDFIRQLQATPDPPSSIDNIYNPTDYSYVEAVHSIQLDQDPPESVIPARCSFRMRNVTEAIAVGGVVRTLRMTTGFNSLDLTVPVSADGGFTNEALQGLIDNIKVNPRTRHYDAEEFRQTQQKNLSVVDQSRSTMFEPFNPHHTLAVTGYTFRDELLKPTYTPIAIVFEPFVASGDTPNKYEINIVSQFLAHYVQGSMLQALAIDPKSGPQQLNRARNHEEATGSSFNSVVSSLLGAGAGMLGSQLLPNAAKLAPMLM